MKLNYMEEFTVKPTSRVHLVKITLVAIILSMVIYIIGEVLGKDFFMGILIVWGIAVLFAIIALIPL